MYPAGMLGSWLDWGLSPGIRVGSCGQRNCFVKTRVRLFNTPVLLVFGEKFK